MTQQKMNEINAWTKKIKASNIDVTDQMKIANATVKMLEEIEPIYDKYNGGGRGKEERYRD